MYLKCESWPSKTTAAAISMEQPRCILIRILLCRNFLSLQTLSQIGKRLLSSVNVFVCLPREIFSQNLKFRVFTNIYCNVPVFVWSGKSMYVHENLGTYMIVCRSYWFRSRDRLRYLRIANGGQRKSWRLKRNFRVWSICIYPCAIRRLIRDIDYDGHYITPFKIYRRFRNAIVINCKYVAELKKNLTLSYRTWFSVCSIKVPTRCTF
jgi:hypothetical protein